MRLKFVFPLLLITNLFAYGCSEKTEACEKISTRSLLGMGLIEKAGGRIELKFLDSKHERVVPIALASRTIIDQPLPSMAGHKVLFEGAMVDVPARCSLNGVYGAVLKLSRVTVVE